MAISYHWHFSKYSENRKQMTQLKYLALCGRWSSQTTRWHIPIVLFKMIFWKTNSKMHWKNWKLGYLMRKGTRELCCKVKRSNTIEGNGWTLMPFGMFSKGGKMWLMAYLSHAYYISIYGMWVCRWTIIYFMLLGLGSMLDGKA
jgi:hypothetical protein